MKNVLWCSISQEGRPTKLVQGVFSTKPISIDIILRTGRCKLTPDRLEKRGPSKSGLIASVKEKQGPLAFRRWTMLEADCLPPRHCISIECTDLAPRAPSISSHSRWSSSCFKLVKLNLTLPQLSASIVFQAWQTSPRRALSFVSKHSKTLLRRWEGKTSCMTFCGKQEKPLTTHEQPRLHEEPLQRCMPLN